jgi:hypothetical protein
MSDERHDRLLRWYPEAWRDRYGDELLAMVEDVSGGQRPHRALRWSLFVSGLREHLRASRAFGADVSPSERLRGGAALVLVAWAIMLPAGFSFAKVAEHWSVAVPSAARPLPRAAMDLAQLMAVVGGVVVVAIAVSLTPGVLSALRRGGLSRLRIPGVFASALSVSWVVMSVHAVLVAHQLTEAQRNGASRSYTTLVLCWGALTVVTVAAWTWVALGLERVLPATALLVWAEGLGAQVLTAVIGLITLAAVGWWASVASAAPWFLQGQATGSAASPWTWRLGLTALAMACACALALLGTVRVSRGRRALQA